MATDIPVATVREPETINVTYLGETHTLRRDGDAWVSDTPCIVKTLRVEGGALTLELNIIDLPES